MGRGCGMGRGRWLGRGHGKAALTIESPRMGGLIGGRPHIPERPASVVSGDAAPALSAVRTASIDDEQCIQCGICVDVCQSDAIEMADRVRIIPEKCIGCGVCVSECPRGAISM